MENLNSLICSCEVLCGWTAKMCFHVQHHTEDGDSALGMGSKNLGLLVAWPREAHFPWSVRSLKSWNTSSSQFLQLIQKVFHRWLIKYSYISHFIYLMALFFHQKLTTVHIFSWRHGCHSLHHVLAFLIFCCIVLSSLVESQKAAVLYSCLFFSCHLMFIIFLRQ